MRCVRGLWLPLKQRNVTADGVPTYRILVSAFSTQQKPASPSGMADSGIVSARLLFLGPPGAGKGTFAAKLAPALSVPHISTGDIIRDEIKRGTTRGKLVRQLSEAGELVPDQVVIEMTQDRLSRSDAARGFILDGFPRTRAQAEALDTFSPVDAVIDVEFPEDLLVLKIASRRVCTCCGRNYNLANIKRGDVELAPLLPKVEGTCDACGGKLVQRADDAEDVVRHRIQVYHQETEPLIDFYRARGVLTSFQVRKGIEDTPLLTTTVREFLLKRQSQNNQAAAAAVAFGAFAAYGGLGRGTAARPPSAGLHSSSGGANSSSSASSSHGTSKA